MAELLKGAEVAGGMKAELSAKVSALRDKGVVPRLGILRVGEKPGDLSYEKGATKRCESLGLDSKVFSFSESTSNEAFMEEFRRINDDGSIHGVLVLRPLPLHMDEERVKAMIDPSKDVDGMSPVNVAKVFAGADSGFAPCTARAVMEIIRHYNVRLKGMRATVVGRSMVAGRPLAMLLLDRHATVTVCHTRTADLAGECRKADVLITAAGAPKMIKASYVGAGATVIDVGINVDEHGRLCGDVDFEGAEPVAGKITPVPGGVGAVTSSVLAMHTIIACEAIT